MQATFAKVARRFSGYLEFNLPLSNRFINKLSLADYRFVSYAVPRECIPNRAHLLSGRIHFTSRRLCGTAVAMSDTGEWREFLNQEDARELDNSLFFEYKFPVSQCLELAGLSVAQAVVRCYPPQDLGVESPKVLVCCGPGNNGGDGLVAAKHLFFFGYEPVIFYPKRTSKEIYQTVVTQCETLHVPFIDKLPTAADIDSQYHVIVDAIFGFSFKGAVRAPFDTVLATLMQVKKPLASVDVPSGWDVEKGDVDGNGLQPDLLISLTAPKECSKFFKGRFHYAGFRFVPPELAAKFRLKLPPYQGSDLTVRLK